MRRKESIERFVVALIGRLDECTADFSSETNRNEKFYRPSALN